MAFSMKKTMNNGMVNDRDKPATPRKVKSAIKKHTNVTIMVDALKT